MPDIAHKSHPDTQLFRLLNGALGRTNHREIAERTVSIKNRRGWRLMDNADVRSGIVTAILKTAAVAIGVPCSVRAYAAQIRVHKQPANERRVIVGQSGFLITSR